MSKSHPPAHKTAAVNRVLKPRAGQLTFEAEGQEGGLYHSRKLHVPPGSSGLTLGRGYDMKTKSRARIEADLRKAGVSRDSAKQISAAAGKSGAEAKKFIKTHDLSHFEIDSQTQVRLFEQSYKEEQNAVMRICNKPDVVAKYGKVDWDKLNPAIKDAIVDLKFRGDYSGHTRQRIQKYIVNNDLAGLTKDLNNRDAWAAVPKDRFDRRAKYMQNMQAASLQSNPQIPLRRP